MHQTTASRADLASVSELLARAVPYSVTGDANVDAMTDGAELWALSDPKGQTVGAYATADNSTAAGACIDVIAAGGLPGFDLVGDMDAALTTTARERGAVHLRCMTRRRGLVHRLQRCGWRVAGYVMTKEV